MPAITAPSQPSRHRLVTIAPAMTTPITMDRKAYRNLKPSRKAAIDPVQAPVIGRGMATNNVKPIFSYFSMVFLRRLVWLKTQLTAFWPTSTRLTALANESKNSKRIGTGSRLPITAKQKALYHGIWNKFIAMGKVPRNSTNGKADTVTIISSREIFQLRNCSIIILWLLYHGGRLLTTNKCQSEAFAWCHSEPFTCCHSEGEKRPKNRVQDRLREGEESLDPSLSLRVTG